jgi:hypothetical protein
MTLTHELLHAHVTGILSTILGDADNVGVSDQSFQKQYEGFKAACQAAEDEKPCVPATMIDSLRFMIFAFASARSSALEQLVDPPESKTNTGTTSFSVGVAKTFDRFTKEIRCNLRVLEEVIVHSLDLRYFYAGDVDLFLKLLWSSWTTVPAVVSDLETYVLRSLAAAASVDPAPTVQRRFDNAFGKLKTVLRELVIGGPSNRFLGIAQNYIAHNEARLRELFCPMLYAADMAGIFLCSKKIEATMWSNDPNIDAGPNNRLGYNFGTADFTSGTVRNPIPFLAERLRRGPTDYHNLDEDYRSAWLLLATASADP